MSKREVLSEEAEVFMHITASVLLEPSFLFAGNKPAHEPIVVINFLKLVERHQKLLMGNRKDSYTQLSDDINAFCSELPDDSYKRIKAAMRKRRSRWAVGTAPKVSP